LLNFLGKQKHILRAEWGSVFGFQLAAGSSRAGCPEKVKVKGGNGCKLAWPVVKIKIIVRELRCCL